MSCPALAAVVPAITFAQWLASVFSHFLRVPSLNTSDDGCGKMRRKWTWACEYEISSAGVRKEAQQGHGTMEIT